MSLCTCVQHVCVYYKSFACAVLRINPYTCAVVGIDKSFVDGTPVSAVVVYTATSITPKSGASRAHNKHSVSQSIGTTTCVYDHMWVFTCTTRTVEPLQSGHP